MFRSLAEVRKANAAAGEVWFDPAHHPRIRSKLYRGRYWIELREVDDDPWGRFPLAYRIAEVLESGRIRYATEERFADLATARRRIRQLAAALPSRFCPKCSGAWITHNGDGSCVTD